jgi:DNA repair exonuclease SbcCD ATPase subunit
MNRDNDLIDDSAIPSIVPERDELVTHRKQKRGTSATGSGAGVRSAPRDYAPEVVVGRTSGAVVTMISILFIGMLGTGAAGYYFHSQAEQTKAELLAASSRIAQLENHLKLVDQAAEQSSMDLVERVNFNFSEIDKLWAARNTLRTEVGELKTNVTQLQTTSKELQTTVSSHSQTLEKNVVAMQARIDEINRNFAGMDNLGEQLTLLNADLNRVKTSMSSVQEQVNSRLNSFEQDIESINVYRLQVNQTIATLQENLNRLQQRVGAP